MKLLVIYRGYEGSSYLVNRLSRINILHDLGFEVFDRYHYIMKNINKEDILSTFEKDICKKYNLDYNNKIPFCKCRISEYYDYESYEQFHELIKKCNITHILHLARFDFEGIIRLNYLQKNSNQVNFGSREDSLGQFNTNRNDLAEKIKGSLIVENKNFDRAIKEKKNYVNAILKERRLISEWKDVKLLNINYTELVNLNDDKFYSIIKNFFNITNITIIENESKKINKKNYSWIDLFDEKSQQYLKNKEKLWNQFINNIEQ